MEFKWFPAYLKSKKFESSVHCCGFRYYRAWAFLPDSDTAGSDPFCRIWIRTIFAADMDPILFAADMDPILFAADMDPDHFGCRYGSGPCLRD